MQQQKKKQYDNRTQKHVEKKVEVHKSNTDSLFSFDKVLFFLGLPYILTLLGSITLNKEEMAQAIFALLIGHALMVVFMRSEKKNRIEKGENKSKNILAWFVFGFGFGFFAWGTVFGVIFGALTTFLANKFKMHTNYLSLILGGAWVLNLIEAISSDFGLVNKSIYLYSPSIWGVNFYKILLLILVVLAVGIYVQFYAQSRTKEEAQELLKKKEEERKNKENKKNEQPQEEEVNEEESSEEVMEDDEEVEEEEQQQQQPVAKQFFQESDEKVSWKKKFKRMLNF